MPLTLTISATIASIAFAVSSVAYLSSGCACLLGKEEEEEEDDNNTNNRKPLVNKTNESESYQSQNNTTIGNQKGTISEATQRSKQQTSRSAPTTRSTTINRVNETSLLEKAVAQNALQNQQRGPSYKSPPVSMSKRSASGKQQTLFCACGAPSSANVVKLLPCGCRTLCMPCAQEAENCPLCGEHVEDSEPSFKTQRRV
jgi:hypothetical protein